MGTPMIYIDPGNKTGSAHRARAVVVVLNKPTTGTTQWLLNDIQNNRDQIPPLSGPPKVCMAHL